MVSFGIFLYDGHMEAMQNTTDTPKPEKGAKKLATQQRIIDAFERILLKEGIDGLVHIESAESLTPGDFCRVRITDADEYDLYAVPVR